MIPIEEQARLSRTRYEAFIVSQGLPAPEDTFDLPILHRESRRFFVPPPRAEHTVVRDGVEYVIADSLPVDFTKNQKRDAATS